MLITVRVKTAAKNEIVRKIFDNRFEIRAGETGEQSRQSPDRRPGRDRIRRARVENPHLKRPPTALENAFDWLAVICVK
jgi:hypothetical protein